MPRVQFLFGKVGSLIWTTVNVGEQGSPGFTSLLAINYDRIKMNTGSLATSFVALEWYNTKP